MINIKPLQITPVVFPWVNETTADGLTFVKEHPGKVEMPDLLECFDFRILQEEEIPIIQEIDTICTVNFKSIFTTYVRFVGFEKAVTEMNTQELQKIGNAYLAWNKKLYSITEEIPWLVIGDDLAGNNGPFVSPATYEKKYFPIIRDFISDIHVQTGKQMPQAIFHSCGDIFKLLDLIGEVPFITGIHYQRIGQMEKIKNKDYMLSSGGKIEFIENTDPFYGTKYQKETT